MATHDLILYRNLESGDILEDVSRILAGDLDDAKASDLMNSVTGRLIELAANRGYGGNLWQAYLTHLIVNSENAYSVSCEINEGTSPYEQAAFHDLCVFRRLFMQSIEELDDIAHTENAGLITGQKAGDDKERGFDSGIRDIITGLCDRLALSSSDEEFAKNVDSFYKNYGVGTFGLHKAFRISDISGKAGIVPIENVSDVDLDDLVGMESAKKKLTDNTEAFLAKRPCNNCLLFGDAGTGKSTSIKGLLNRYYDRGLRMIEIYKHQLGSLSDVMDQIRNRNYRFIIYMDDLSFEDHETEYKYLKAVIEGGLEKKPENVLIYATSNRRHIVREKYSDRFDGDDELHTNDTVQEKLSLSYRFGESIFFPRPGRKEYDEIVKTLAKRSGITMDEKELLLEASKWELSHGGMSGRTARQFVDMLTGVTA